MSNTTENILDRLEKRLAAMDAKLDTLSASRGKSMEWIGVLSQHVESLDRFREEVRATFEPISRKLDAMDEVIRIMRHATSDVSRKVEDIEKRRLAS